MNVDRRLDLLRDYISCTTLFDTSGVDTRPYAMPETPRDLQGKFDDSLESFHSAHARST